MDPLDWLATKAQEQVPPFGTRLDLGRPGGPSSPTRITAVIRERILLTGSSARLLSREIGTTLQGRSPSSTRLPGSVSNCRELRLRKRNPSRSAGLRSACRKGIVTQSWSVSASGTKRIRTCLPTAAAIRRSIPREWPS